MFVTCRSDFSIITGRVVTFIIEGITGIVFFTIDKSVYIGLAVMLVISIAVCLAVSIVSQGTSRVAKRSKAANICAKPGRSAHNTDAKHIINRHNYIRQTGSRLMRSQGIIQNISIRVFSLAIMVIVITCVVNGITVYGKYRTVSEKQIQLHSISRIRILHMWLILHIISGDIGMSMTKVC